MDLPIELFLSFIAFAVVMGIIGLWKRIPIMMFIAGAVITFWAITTDNVIMQTFSDINTVDTMESNGTVFGRSYIYNVNFTNSVQLSTTSFSGAEFADTTSALIGESFQCMEILISRTVTLPDNPIYLGVMNSTGHLTLNFTSLNPSDVSQMATQYEACLPANTYYTIVSGDRIGAKAIIMAGSRSYILFQDQSDPFDGTNSYRQGLSNLNVWSGNTMNDMTMKLYNITSTTVPIVTTTYTYEQSQDLYPFTEYPKILFGLIASIFMLAGALVWKYEEN